MDLRLILFGALVFGAVGLLVWGVFTGWNKTRSPEAERVARRLRAAIGDSGTELAVSITKERTYSRDASLNRLLTSVPGIAKLDRLLLQAGRTMSTAQLCTLMGGCALVGFIVFSSMGLPWVGRLVLAGLCGWLPVLEAMRAGHAFPTALKMVGEEMQDVVGAEFRVVFDEVNFGVAMPDALMNLATRVPSTDLRYFVIAVLIQRETGGNLTDLLTSISAIIRDRLKLLGQVRVMSAEGRMSAWVLGLLPFAVGGLATLANPGALDPLFTDPLGRKMLYGAAGMMLLGVFAIRKITHIRV